MSDDRPSIHACVTPEARDAWHRFCDEGGISASGLVEAIGLHLLNDPDFAEAEAITKHARRVDAMRRRRGADRNSG